MAVSKGAATREVILDEATRLISRVGLGGLTIGMLASQAHLSKSGLFAHFRSKEALQLQVLDYAAARFREQVVRPALTQPRGEPRLRDLFGRWLSWEAALPGGCVFVAAAAEIHDHTEPVRDRLIQIQHDWLEAIRRMFLGGVAEGHFRADADPDQFAQDFYGALLAYHFLVRLRGGPAVPDRAERALETLLAAAR